MKYSLVLLILLLFAGCSADENLNSQNKAGEVTYKKLTIREIDSLSAAENYSFSILNKAKDQTVPVKAVR
jgi:PBP1b-binding outer membrane lipoprotein LpoB